MPRMMLTDARWEALSQLLLDSGRVYNKAEHRLTLEGILYKKFGTDLFSSNKLQRKKVSEGLKNEQL